MKATNTGSPGCCSFFSNTVLRINKLLPLATPFQTLLPRGKAAQTNTAEMGFAATLTFISSKEATKVPGYLITIQLHSKHKVICAYCPGTFHQQLETAKQSIKAGKLLLKVYGIENRDLSRQAVLQDHCLSTLQQGRVDSLYTQGGTKRTSPPPKFSRPDSSFPTALPIVFWGKMVYYKAQLTRTPSNSVLSAYLIGEYRGLLD